MTHQKYILAFKFHGANKYSVCAIQYTERFCLDSMHSVVGVTYVGYSKSDFIVRAGLQKSLQLRKS